MAPIIAGIKAIAAITIPLTGGLTIGKLVVTAAISYGIGRLLADDPKPRKTPVRFFTIMAMRPNGARVCIYGKAIVAPQICVARTLSGHQSLIGTLCDHPLEKIVNVELNSEKFFSEEEIKSLQEDGYVHPTTSYVDGQGQLRGEVNAAKHELTDGRYDSYYNPRSGFRIYRDWKFGGSCFLGVSLSGDGSKTAGLAKEWEDSFHIPHRQHQAVHAANSMQTPAGGVSSDDSFRLSGTSWMYFGMLRTPKDLIENNGKRPIWNSVPNITFACERSNDTLELPAAARGIPFRRGNAALCLYDYLKRYTPYGEETFGIKQLNDASFMAAALTCETRNWTCNGAFDLETSPSGIIEEILAAMGGGSLASKNGVLYAYAGGTTAISQSYMADDIEVNAASRSIGGPVADRVASVEVGYRGEDGEEKSVRINYTPRDGSVLPYTTTTRLEATFINNESQAKAHATNVIRRIWEGEAVEFMLLDQSRLPDPWDRILITLDDIGLKQEVRVTAVEKLPDGRIRIVGVKEADDHFKEERDPYKPPAKPKPIQPPTIEPPGRTTTPPPTLPPPTLPPSTGDDDLLLVRINSQDQTIDLTGGGKLRV